MLHAGLPSDLVLVGTGCVAARRSTGAVCPLGDGRAAKAERVNPERMKGNL
jgi:hypothetical protein